MGNPKYNASAKVERDIVDWWKGVLKERNLRGYAVRSAGSRGRFDVLLTAIVRGRQVAIGVQVKCGVKPTRALVKEIQRFGWEENGLIGLVAWKVTRQPIRWIPVSPENVLASVEHYMDTEVVNLSEKY